MSPSTHSFRPLGHLLSCLALMLLLPGMSMALERLGERNAQAPANRLEVLDEDATGLTLSWEMNGVDQVATPDGLLLTLPGEGQAGGPGDPSLPLISRLLAAPGDAAARIELVDAEVESFHLAGLAPRPWPASDRPDSGNRAAQPSDAFSTTGDWPGAWLGECASVLWMGHRVQSLDLQPLRWHPLEQRVDFLRRATLRLTWQHGTLPAPLPRVLDGEALAMVKHRALNSQSPWLALEDRTVEEGPAGSYLVVVPDAALSAMGEWIHWKRRLGHEVRVLLESQAGGQDATTAQLRSAIAAEFTASPFQYLLLVGDVDRYPSGTELDYNLMGDFTQGGQYAESGWGGRCGSSYCIVTDHPFSLQEGDDYFPDLLVGRWSVDTANDLAKIVRKNVDYDAAPYTGLGTQWFQSGLMIYETMGGPSRRETKLAIRDLLMQGLNYTRVDTVHNRYWDNPVSPEVVRQRVNSGVGLVNYRGYGFRTQWYGPMFGVEHVNALTNVGRWPFVTSIVCGGGDFASIDDDPSFGEAWMRAGSNPAEPTGAIAFMGPSEEDTHTEWNNCIDENIYHGLVRGGLRSLGSLMVAGKTGLWLDYPNARNWGQTGYSVPFYFHAYNLQGDPGLHLRTAPPRRLICQLPDTLAAGSMTLDLVVQVEDGLALDGLKGSLYLQGQDLSILAHQEGEGRLRFTFDSMENGLPAGDWDLTLWGQDLMPVLATLPSAARASVLNLAQWSLSEEVADSLISPGESFDLHVHLREDGTAGFAGTRQLSLAAPLGGLDITGSTVELPATLPGEVVEAAQGLAFRLDTQQLYGEDLPLDLLVDGQVLGRILVKVDMADLALLAVEAVDGALQPGTESSLRFQVQARGLPVADSLWFRLGSLHSGVSVVEGEGLSAPVPPDSSVWVEGFRVAVDAHVQPGSLAVFELGSGIAGDALFTGLSHISAPLGAAALEDPLGPDSAGYIAIHSADEHDLAPAHTWDSIADSGEEVVVMDWLDSWGDNPDGVSRVVDLPFTFRYYGQDYTQVTLCSNGWLAFGAQPDVFTALNTPIPAAQGPNAMIAAYWTDLINSSGGSQAFGHLYMESRPAVGLFVVEWNHFRPIGTANNVDVQLILRDPAVWPTATGNGDILLHLHDITTSNGDNGVTIGLESPDERGGLPYAFNNQWAPAAQPITDGCSLLFTCLAEENALQPEDGPASPALLSLHPNPFNPVTRLRLQAPPMAELRWQLVNVLGQTLREQAWERRPDGVLEARIDGGGLASGLYFVHGEWRTAQASGRITEKALLLK